MEHYFSDEGVIFLTRAGWENRVCPLGFIVFTPTYAGYTVPDDVQPGWVKQPEGHFAPPPPPEPAPPVVPVAVTLRQARLALLGRGLLAQVNTAVAALPGVIGDAARVEWEYATEVRRDSALTASMAAALGLNDAALDALFTQALEL